MALLKTNTGIGTTNPTSALHVIGDGLFTGVVTATTFSGQISSGVGTFTNLTATNATLTNINSSGITTLGVTTVTRLTAQNIFTSGVTTSVGGFVGNLTGIAASATQLVTPRTFEITGDIVASPISFNGTGNVSLAATIQPNSVALGNDTTGDYVQTVTGTSNQITVTGGTGEGSTPTLSFPNQVIIPQDLTVLRDVQIDRNLNVNGNITIGGTSATIFSRELKIFDPDIILGFRTDAFGNDISNDNTANHGGVAVASTEGNPLVQLFIAGIETNPATYKKIMWFKAGEFAGLGTDAWLMNYAVGIGSTQFPTGTRLAAGSVQFTERDLAVVRNINASGIITAVQFIGTASTASFATTAYNLTDAANITAGTINAARLSGTYNINISGNAVTATYATSAGVATNVIGGIASVTQLSVSGISTLGIVTATQLYVSGVTTSVGGFVGNLTGTASTASFATTSSYLSDANNILSGTINVARLSGTYDIDINGNATTANYATNAGVSTNVIGGIASVTQFSVSGVSTLGTVQISSGIITATSGIVTYYGDGSNLQGIIAAAAIGVQDEGVTVGAAVTTLNFSGATVSVSNAVGGISTVTVVESGIANYALVAGIATYANVAGVATYATNAGVATNVIGGIASVTQLSVSGISTLGVVTAGNIFSTGIVTALSFVGNLTGTATTASFATTAFTLNGTSETNLSVGFARSAGIATNLRGGVAGNVPYQSDVDTTAFVSNGLSGQVLLFNGSIPVWGNVSAASGAFGGISVQDEGTPVGTANSISTLNFVSPNLSVTATSGANGIATITMSNNIVGSALSISGISTLGVTSATNLTAQQLNVSGVSTISVNSSTDALRITQTGSGNALLVEDSANPDSTPFVITATGRVGIGTTNPVSYLDIYGGSYGDAYIRGDNGAELYFQVSRGDTNSHNSYISQTYDGYTTLLAQPNGSANSNYIFQYHYPTKTSRFQADQVDVIKLFGDGGGTYGRACVIGDSNSLTRTTTPNQVLQVAGGAYVSDSVGIATTRPTSRLHVIGDALVVGVVTATTFSGNATSATYATNAGVATYATNAGVATYASTAGVATALQNARDFSITGSFVTATAISFNGTGNVALAATITPDSIGLGTHTTGDYVRNISGTSNQITVTGGTGEGSTPTLSIPNQFTAPQDVTVTRDLQVNRNLNVNGNITIGGTSAVIFSQSLNIFDPDIVLGYRTDANNNDVSNDNTANHGGIAIASTEGTPLVQLFIAGIETNPATYKKIMWFKSGTFSGLNTDAWLSNYAIGIGSTQFPTGTRLAAGSVQFTENDLAVVRNINASGISTFAGITTNTSTLFANQLSVSGVSTFAGITTVTGTTLFTRQLSVSGVSTIGNFRITPVGSGATVGGIGVTYFGDGSQLSNIVTGIAVTANTTNQNQLIPYATSFGSTTGFGATASGLVFNPSTTRLGIGTTNPLQNLHIQGNLLVAAGSATTQHITQRAYELEGGSLSWEGTAGQLFSITNNLTSGPIFSVNDVSGIPSIEVTADGTIELAPFADGNVGIATTRPTSRLHVVGDGLVTGVVTATTFSGNATSATFATTAGVSTSVIGGIASVTQISVSGVSTFAGITTSTSTLFANQLSVAGVSTFAGITTVTGPTLFSRQLSVAGVASIFSDLIVNSGTFDVDAANNRVGVLTTFPLQPFQVNPTGSSVVVVDTLGRLGIGITNPTSKLHVIGDALITGVSTIANLRIIPVGSGATVGGIGVTYFGDGSQLSGISAGLSITDDTSTNATRYILFDDSISGTVTSINVSSTKLTFNPSTGNLVAGGTVTANSDEKLKENVKTIENALDKVLSLRGVEFDRIDTGDHQIGVIAQEVEKIIPDVVYPKQPSPDYETKSVAYANLVGLLIEAVKEQNRRIDELERRLEGN